MRTAVVCDWLATYAGAERVAEAMLSVWPDADVFAVCDFLEGDARKFLGDRRVTATFIQNLPFAREKYRSYLPLMPLAIEQLDLSGYDLVISSSHAVAKGVITHPGQLHISYVHTPMRYAWDMQSWYLKNAGLDHGLKGWIAKAALHYIRLWDRQTADGVDGFIANSRFIANRIWRCYRREANVIYPPVDVDKFTVSTDKEDYYLTASRLVPYKKVGIIAEAFRLMPDKKLVIIGDGQELAKIRAAAGKNVTVMGFQPDPVLIEKMRHARAFIFAAEEDFGIIPVEAQAAGTPVIAYGKGGAIETVIPEGENGATGLFFDEQTPEAIAAAVARFEETRAEITPENCRKNAEKFSRERFCREIKDYVIKFEMS